MPRTANITTTSGPVFTFPAGCRGCLIQNEDDTDIRIRFGQLVSVTLTASTATTGVLLPAKVSTVPTSLSFDFGGPLARPMTLDAVHGGSGSKQLTVEAFFFPVGTILSP